LIINDLRTFQKIILAQKPENAHAPAQWMNHAKAVYDSPKKKLNHF
jgi:hypothetical protein